MVREEQEHLVSVSCLTYNHGDYLRKSLNGILMQKTNFTFEILIHDDASTDNTVEIIKEYQEKYPNIIKPIFQDVNQYSLGQRGMNLIFNFSRANGRYIALCEGDDYWVDPLKLQKQIDFLEKNPSYSASFHDVKIVFKDKTCSYFKKYHPFLDNVNTVYFKDFINQNFHIPTCSFVFRKDEIDSPPFANRMNYEDFILFSCALLNSKAYVLHDQMAVYRKNNPGSVTNNKAMFDSIRIKADYIEFLTWLRKQANEKEQEYIVDRIFTEVQTIRRKVDMYKGSKIFSLYSRALKHL